MSRWRMVKTLLMTDASTFCHVKPQPVMLVGSLGAVPLVTNADRTRTKSRFALGLTGPSAKLVPLPPSLVPRTDTTGTDIRCSPSARQTRAPQGRLRSQLG